MKISAVNVNNYCVGQNNNKNASFNGLIKVVDQHSTNINYGPQTSPHQIYSSWSTDSYVQTYHPFKDETKEKIAEELDKNNYQSSMDCGGVAVDLEYKTTLGKTIPFTENEWKKLPKEMQEKFESLL